MVGGDDDIRKRFVVPQQDVKARPQALDQVGLEQQRLGLGAGDDEFQRPGRRDHALNAGVEPGRPRVGTNAVPDILCLADIEHVAARIDHAVDAGLRRRQLGVTEDGGPACGKRVLDLAVGSRNVAFFRFGKRRLLVFLNDLDLGLDVFFRNAHA